MDSHYNQNFQNPAMGTLYSQQSIHYVTDSLLSQDVQSSASPKPYFKHWFYFPDGIRGPMFTRLEQHSNSDQKHIGTWLENGRANYLYAPLLNTVFIRNYHVLCATNPRTRCIPSDPPDFVDFLNRVEGRIAGITYTHDPKTGLLVGALDARSEDLQNQEVTIAYNTGLNETFFLPSWPSDVPIVDQRDAMHKRGWTYFRVTGKIDGQEVTGWGQIPFVYEAAKKHPPWLRLNIGNKLQLLDCPSAAQAALASGEVIATYPPGCFFKGLARPWTGMHTLDIVRRDAAEQRFWFETRLLESSPTHAWDHPHLRQDEPHNNKAQVVLANDRRRPTAELTYLIDIQKDVLERIELAAYRDVGKLPKGVLKFEYLEDIEPVPDEFVVPLSVRAPPATNKADTRTLWLVEILQGTLGR